MRRGSVGCASLSQDGRPRLRNGAQTPASASGGSTCPPDTIVNEIADGKIELDLASVISATRVSIHLLTRFSINHQLPGITGVCLLSMHTGCACPPDSSFPAPSFFFEGTG